MFGANRKKFTEAGPEGDDSCGGLYYGQQSAFAAHRADKDMLASSAASSSGQLSQLGASLYGPQSALGFPVRGINSSAAPLSRSALGQSAAGQLSAHTGAAVVHTPPSPSRGILPVSSRGVLAHNQQAGGPAGQPIGMGGERGGGAGGRSAGGSSPSVIGMPKQSRQAFTINSMAGFGVNRNPGFNIFNGTANPGPDWTQKLLLVDFVAFEFFRILMVLRKSGRAEMLHLRADGSENVTALDLSDFPALADRARRDGGADPVPPLDPLAGRAPYVGMVTKPSSEQSRDFSIHNEDFPALPGPNYHAKDPGGDDGKTNLGSSGKPASNSDGPRFPGDKCSASASGNDQHKKGIQVLPDGRVTNIPVGMVTDQFGMIGLLTFIRAAETDPGTVHLALGSDLTALGLNLNSPENLYPKFASPWASAPCRPQDIDFHVPSEYLTNIHIRDKLQQRLALPQGGARVDHARARHGAVAQDQRVREGDVLLLRLPQLEESCQGVPPGIRQTGRARSRSRHLQLQPRPAGLLIGRPAALPSVRPGDRLFHLTLGFPALLFSIFFQFGGARETETGSGRTSSRPFTIKEDDAM
ncbi:CCR4-NOT transcription complex subunit 2-like isoform X4 [Phyllopteryx taeniolatus]|uniref:CCR4-NOT transcription complex subunit 2-like isoform X4 n=1 Tax=Phyllopteryx taeniolatus TaxID=161469 RepID=UPI002AD248F6|nr:CCR4-NOT transcription complex subunit 2-like isoform X4 [Phyllopteryx taeniolatus]